jgi:hypothetical protein
VRLETVGLLRSASSGGICEDPGRPPARAANLNFADANGRSVGERGGERRSFLGDAVFTRQRHDAIGKLRREGAEIMALDRHRVLRSVRPERGELCRSLLFAAGQRVGQGEPDSGVWGRSASAAGPFRAGLWHRRRVPTGHKLQLGGRRIAPNPDRARAPARMIWQPRRNARPMPRRFSIPESRIAQLIRAEDAAITGVITDRTNGLKRYRPCPAVSEYGCAW